MINPEALYYLKDATYMGKELSLSQKTVKGHDLPKAVRLLYDVPYVSKLPDGWTMTATKMDTLFGGMQAIFGEDVKVDKEDLWALEGPVMFIDFNRQEFMYHGIAEYVHTEVLDYEGVGSVEELDDDWELDIQKCELMLMEVFSPEKILDRCVDEESYPEDDNYAAKLSESMKITITDSVDFWALNMGTPMLWYPVGGILKYTKKVILESTLAERIKPNLKRII